MPDTVTLPVRIRAGDGPETEIGTIELDGPDARPALAALFRAAADYLDPQDPDR
ncbi:hypothetical protein OG331_31830 [Streptomyces sp. NBC_01017]|uniref:hypothetical protein n=1 Tax=Streptomyces sp. NBC_01017 TaxID=2903721 RepID=UPI00386BD452|nr:hypothetical protein OG331_31830 [Streptomyces sp. NBC_01017]